MAVDLNDFIEPLKREVRPPGSTLFSEVTAPEWVGYLSDAFWEARLDGFLVGYTVDVDNQTIEPEEPSIPDVSRREATLLVLYAGIKVLRNKILNTNTQFRAKAGGVEFEQQNSANVLVEILKDLKATKDRILVLSEDYGGTPVQVIDAFSSRLWSVASYHGSPELMG